MIFWGLYLTEQLREWHETGEGRGHMQRGVKGHIQTLSAASGSRVARSTSWADQCAQREKLPYWAEKLPNLLVVGEAAHDGGVNDAAEHHGQRVDGQRAVAGLLLHQVTQLLIGHLHGLYGVLQRTDLLLFYRESEVNNQFQDVKETRSTPFKRRGCFLPLRQIWPRTTSGSRGSDRRWCKSFSRSTWSAGQN